MPSIGASVEAIGRSTPLTTAEMETAVNHRWGFGDKAVLSVAKEGGLAPGRHHVAVELQLRISYLPWISVNKFEQDMVLA